MEMVLADFIRKQRAVSLPVTTKVLQAKARELSREQGLSMADFKASRGWLQKFMKRFGFSLCHRTSIAQKLPSDFEEKLIEFQRYVLRKQKSRAYLLGQIGNADQTPVYSEMAVAYTVNEKGAKEVNVLSARYEKQRATDAVLHSRRT